MNSTAVSFPPNHKAAAALKKRPNNDSANVFWRKHCLIVAIDACEIFDRIFCQCGLAAVFQDAYTLTALDKRTFAPPLESQWQRVVNMANACESFKMNPKTVVQLIDHGFKSVTLLSMAKTNMIKLPHRASEQQHFKECLGVLNDRRSTTLEPLHSLGRFAYAKRKRLHQRKRMDFLDLANEDFSKLEPNLNYKRPQPMIAKSTFKTTDSHHIFGPAKACLCSNKPRKILSSTSSTSSSGYSSSIELSPDSTHNSPVKVARHFVPEQQQPEKPGLEIGKNTKIAKYEMADTHSCRRQAVQPPKQRHHQQTLSYHQRRNTPRQVSYSSPHQASPRDYTSWNNNAHKGSRVFCPRPDCSSRLHLDEVEDHCSKVHQISTANGARAFTYAEIRQYSDDSSETYRKTCGDVRLSLNAKEVLNDSKVELWWGPAPFSFDHVTFYQMVYKKDIATTYYPRNDRGEPKLEPVVLFWVWATLPQAEASCYRYEVHLDHKGPDGKHQQQARHYSHYTGVVLPLDIHSHDVTKRHVRSVVYFSQSYLRKTLRFNHNPHTESQKETADVIKYTVKIMRQS